MTNMHVSVAQMCPGDNIGSTGGITVDLKLAVLDRQWEHVSEFCLKF